MRADGPATSAATGTDEHLTDLPRFGVGDYRRLLVTLADNGYDFRPVAEMPEPVAGRTVYMRHDIDLHPTGIERMAEIEAELGIRATYLVLLTQNYNPLYPANRDALRRLAGLGHEIGLHYDLTTFPEDDEAAREHLEWEASIVERVVGTPVRSVSMHQPFEGKPDTFRENGPYVHPHDPRWGEDLVYVSDSCRAWRDETLLRCYGDAAPRRLLLLTHPEVWLADESWADRETFIDQVLIPTMTRTTRDYINLEMRPKWTRHPGPPWWDARLGLR